MRAPRNHESFVYNIGAAPGGCGPALAVAQEPEFVSFAGGHRRRSAGVQVLLADYNDGPRELGAIGGGVVDEAVRAVGRLSCWPFPPWSVELPLTHDDCLPKFLF
jgi:hypothetical protein